MGVWAELPLVTWKGQGQAMSSGTHSGCARVLEREGAAATLTSVPPKAPVCLGSPGLWGFWGETGRKGHRQQSEGR